MATPKTILQWKITDLIGLFYLQITELKPDKKTAIEYATKIVLKIMDLLKDKELLEYLKKDDEVI